LLWSTDVDHLAQISPGATYFASNDRDTLNALELFRTSDHTRVFRIPKPEDASWLAITADEKTLLSISTFVVDVFDVPTGHRISQIRMREECYEPFLYVAHDGRSLLHHETESWSLKLIEIPSGRPIASHNRDALLRRNNSRWDSDNVLYVSAERAVAIDGLEISVWNLRAGRLLSKVSIDRSARHATAVRGAALSPNGRFILTGGGDGIAKLWSLANGALVRDLTGHIDDVSCLSFSPDGRRAATGSKDGTIRIWDLRDGRCLATLDVQKRCEQIVWDRQKEVLFSRMLFRLHAWSTAGL
jgi:WD40 repeat protein